ncbi:hypothetical protein ACIOMM_35415 [Streptomyces sp. NPDC087908]|uniref:hypothetical protein n=1 Tax=Streptomyces sp. NPDC087908 TaxID=3365820 RepID=UPI0037F5A4E2
MGAFTGEGEEARLADAEGGSESGDAVVCFLCDGVVVAASVTDSTKAVGFSVGACIDSPTLSAGAEGSSEGVCIDNPIPATATTAIAAAAITGPPP